MNSAADHDASDNGVRLRVFRAERANRVFGGAAEWAEALADDVDVLGVNWEALHSDPPDTPPAYEMTIFYRPGPETGT